MKVAIITAWIANAVAFDKPWNVQNKHIYNVPVSGNIIVNGVFFKFYVEFYYEGS
jgi:hypothetical protein